MNHHDQAQRNDLGNPDCQHRYQVPRIGAVEIVDRLSRESYLSARWGKTDACRTIQDMANAGKLVREWDERGEVFYTVAA